MASHVFGLFGCSREEEVYPSTERMKIAENVAEKEDMVLENEKQRTNNGENERKREREGGRGRATYVRLLCFLTEKQRTKDGENERGRATYNRVRMREGGKTNTLTRTRPNPLTFLRTVACWQTRFTMAFTAIVN